MAEAAPATTPTEVAPPVETSDESFDAKLEAKLGLSDPKPEAQEATQTEEAPADADALLETDDLEGDLAPPESDYEELDHKGKKVRVSKEEARKLAQMGYDYTSKTQEVAAERKSLAEMRQLVDVRSQIVPQVIDALANVKQVEQALSNYQNVDWIAFSRSDPIGYTQEKANFDALTQRHQMAVGQFKHLANESEKVTKAISQKDLTQEFAKLDEKIPEWRDDSRRKRDQAAMRQVALDVGYTEQELLGVYDHRQMLLLRKAAAYDMAVKARSSKQSAISQAPPVGKPGSVQPARNAQAQKAEVIKQLHQAKDPGRKRELVDKALELKLARFSR